MLVVEEKKELRWWSKAKNLAKGWSGGEVGVK